MPVFRHQDAEYERDESVNGLCEMVRFSDTGGLTQFGAFLETLHPGAASSIKHWHSAEDELIYMLDGVVVVEEGESRTELRPGDAATFKAGVATGHRLVNESDQPARYFVVGTRADRDVVTYPDRDRVLTSDRQADTAVWTDGQGRPASNPYADGW